MYFIGQLWIPILLATVLCFIAASVIWMAGPHHKKEFPGLPNEDDVLAALRKGNVGAGSYMFPYCDRSDKAKFEAGMKKWAEGPAGALYVFPRGQLNMGKLLVQQLLFFLAVSVLIALLESREIPYGSPYMHVFKFTALVTFMCHFLGPIPMSVWFGRPWKSVWLSGIDSLVYAGLTAGAFAWLWPR